MFYSTAAIRIEGEGEKEREKEGEVTRCEKQTSSAQK